MIRTPTGYCHPFGRSTPGSSFTVRLTRSTLSCERTLIVRAERAFRKSDRQLQRHVSRQGALKAGKQVAIARCAFAITLRRLPQRKHASRSEFASVVRAPSEPAARTHLALPRDEQHRVRGHALLPMEIRDITSGVDAEDRAPTVAGVEVRAGERGARQKFTPTAALPPMARRKHQPALRDASQLVRTVPRPPGRLPR